MSVDFETVVPFSYDGVYFRFRFPDELVIDPIYLSTYDVSGYLRAESGGLQADIVDSDLVSDQKYVIVKGAQFNEDRNIQQKFISISFNTIQNPYAQRDTDFFLIDVWKKWDGSVAYPGSLSQEIIRSENSFIPALTFGTNEVDSISVTATNMIV